MNLKFGIETMRKKQSLQEKRKHRVRMKLRNQANRPRLSVFRSNRQVFGQIIDDSKGQTLLAASEKEIAKPDSKKVDIAFALGKLLAEKAKKKKIIAVVFDRGSFAYHGRVKAFADGAREGGLKF